MESVRIKEIRNVLNGEFVISSKNYNIKNISINSKEVDRDSLFIPIIGETHDGHNFLEDAKNNGCRNFLIDKNHTFNVKDVNVIMVDDTIHALGLLAKEYKEMYKLFTVGITGSVGKTSTRDIIYSVVSKGYKTLKNEGNLNNEIGVPKTLFNLDKSYKALVMEMGMNHKGEIRYLTNIVNPDIAVISNIGLSHIENFESQEGIFNAKMEITSNFNKDNILIVNGDDEFLKKVKPKNPGYRVYTFGFNKGNDIYCTNYVIEKDHIDFTAIVNYNEEYFRIPTIAKHNIYNAMAAILVGINMNIGLPKIKEGLSSFTLTKGRQTIINKKYLTIIDDSYNASLDSVKSAVDVLKEFKTRRVAILGDILETGSYNEEIHKKIGDYLNGKIDYLIAVGPSSKLIIDEAVNTGFNSNNVIHFEDYKKLQENITKLLQKNDTVLVKASHGIKLYEVVEYLNKIYE